MALTTRECLAPAPGCVVALGGRQCSTAHSDTEGEMKQFAFVSVFVVTLPLYALAVVIEYSRA